MKKLFVHMPKCAGATVRKLLEDRSESVERDYDSFFRIPRKDRNSAIMDGIFNPKAIDGDKIVFGHFFPIRYIGPETHDEYKLVTILREPISRLISHYLFWKSGDYSDHHLWRKMMNERWSFEEFAFSDEMRNIYAQYFVGVSLSSFSYIGLSENMNSSVVECFSTLGVEVTGDIIIPRENVTSKSETLDLSADIVHKLRDHHADDFLIYEFAKRKFHRSPMAGSH